MDDPTKAPHGSQHANAIDAIIDSLNTLSHRLETARVTRPDPYDAADKQVTRYIRFISFVFTVFALMAGGSLIFNTQSLRASQQQAYADISTQASELANNAVYTAVPQAVDKAVATAVPEVLYIVAATGVARELEAFRPTLVATAASIFATPSRTPQAPTPATLIPPGQPAQYAVIVASDTSTDYLLRLQTSLREKGYSPEIYKIGDVFTLTAGTFDTLDALQEALIAAKAGITERAYFIDLSKSCRVWDFYNPGYYACMVPPG